MGRKVDYVHEDNGMCLTYSWKLVKVTCQSNEASRLLGILSGEETLPVSVLPPSSNWINS